MASSRCYTRRTEWDSLNHLGSGRWASNTLAPIDCAIEAAPLTNTAKPTAFNAEYALVRHIVSFLGIKLYVFWRPNTLASRARSGFIASATQFSPYSPRELAQYSTRATMGCDALGKSARARLRMECIWSDFWTTRSRLHFLSLRRATRLPRGPYKVLGVFRPTSLAPFLGGSNAA